MHINKRFLRRQFGTAVLGLLLILFAAAYVRRPDFAIPVFAGISGRLIVIDAGHGGFDGGAIGASGEKEAVINLAVAKLVKEELVKKGAHVIMTRETEEGLSDTKQKDMAERKAIIEKDGVELVLSIHMNKFSDPKVNGPQVFHMPNSESGERLAKLMLAELNLATGKNKRETHSENFFILRNTPATSVIVECGFISNPAEEALLKQPDYQKRLAAAMVTALEKYYNENNSTPEHNPGALIPSS